MKKKRNDPNAPDPRKEPQSETAEKRSILKTHEEFIDNSRPSLTKKEYEEQQARKNEKPTTNRHK